MKKIYEKQEVWFAVLWIILYCVISVSLRGSFGDESIWMLLGLAAIAAGITVFVKSNHLEEKYGISAWPKDQKTYLWFIPMWLLTTGNLWGGIGRVYSGAAQIYAVISMVLIGYIEELIFRGFLFRALLKKDGEKPAVIIAAVTFGIGHIVNLLAGQASLETVLQVAFAITWGFIFTMVFYKSGSLLPCIVSHALVDAFSKFSVESSWGSWVYVVATIILGALYCVYLSRLPSALSESKKMTQKF